MTNPLNKNKVIRFIKDYPHDGTFSLINTNKSIIVRPGDPGETGTNSGDIIPDSNIPTCSVGLSGAQGNPTNFNELLTLWNDKDQRYKLNPIGLMRLWASIYRTYFGFVKQTKRIYPTANSQLSVVRRKIDPGKDYDILFEDGVGNRSIWNSRTKQYSGGYVEGLIGVSPLSSGKSTALPVTNPREEYPHYFDYYGKGINKGNVILDFVQDIVGVYREAASQTDFTGELRDGEVLQDYYNNTVIRKGLAGSIPVFVPLQSPEGTTTTYGDLEASATPTAIKKRIGVSNQATNLQSVFYYDKLEAPYNLITKATQGPYKLTITFNTPTAIDKIYLPNITLLAPCFVLKSSIDGTTYDEELNFGDYYNTSKLDIYRRPPESPGFVQYQILYFRHPDNNSEYRLENPKSYGYLNSNKELPNNTFNASIASVGNIKNNAYTNLPTFNIGDVIVGHKKTTYNIQKNNTPHTAVFNAFFERHINRNNFDSINYLKEEDACKWELRDATTNTLIQEGTFTFSILDPNRYVKKIEIIYGFDNVHRGNTFFYGYNHPVISGWSNVTTTDSQSNFKTYNELDFTDSFYTNTNPENYTIGSVNIVDNLAKTAYNNKGFSNVLKWKLLPYTLPFSNPTLRSTINNLNLVFSGLDANFEYEEDYLNNSMLRLPSNETELSEHITLSKQLNRDPVIYWFNLRANELLNELINHCKNTCLKFWRLNFTYSVRNYQDYTELVLDVQPETRDIREVSGTIITDSSKIVNTAIQTYVIAEANVDIEKNLTPGELWFLSGGGYTSVDLQSNILSEYIDSLLADGQAGNNNQNPNLI